MTFANARVTVARVTWASDEYYPWSIRTEDPAVHRPSEAEGGDGMKTQRAVLLIMASLIGAVMAACSMTRDAAQCATVPDGWVEQMNLPAGASFWAPAGTASNGHDAWVVGKDDGAAWATDVDPSTTPKEVVPLAVELPRRSIDLTTQP